MFRRLFCLSVGTIFLAALPHAPVYAQEQVVEEIVVTGSRIARKDIEGVAPLTILDRANIESSGKVSLGEFLREQPFVAGQAQTTSVNNGGTGAERVSLRGMGAPRTLVLLNGRRIVGSGNGSSSTGITGTVDLNTIPMSMVERIEVLKDGASAIYGSDAVAGVVNIITREDFSGVEISARWGQTTENDGARKEYSITFGDHSDLGHFMVNATYNNDSEILAGDRSWAEEALGVVNGIFGPSGSSAPPWGNYSLATDPGNICGAPGGCSVTRGPELGAFRPYNANTDTYNFAPINFQTMPNERWMLNFEGDIIFEPLSDTPIADEVRIFAETSYIHRQSKQQLAEVPLAPFAFFGYMAPYSAANAYNPFGEDIDDWRRRVVEGGGRQEHVDHDTKRVVVGMEGTRGNWDWEFYYNYGRNDSDYHFGHIYNLDRVALAVGPTTLNGTGDIVCADSGGNEIPGCVPLDVFSVNGITQDMIDYTTFTTNEDGMQSMETWAANFSNGSLYDLPAGPLGIAGGWTWREYEGRDTPDSQIATLGDAATGTPRTATQGKYHVNELYGEVVIPLLNDQPAAEYMELTAAVRYSDYNTFGSDTTTKFGLMWRPVEDLLLRATRSEAFRAPNISDLYGGSGQSFPDTGDPCADDPTPFCIADGVPAGGYTQISRQVRTLVGGNPTVEEETADTWTAGFVWTPTFWDPIDGLSVAVDYYDISVDNAIDFLGADFILQNCHDTGGTCDLIERFTTGPSIGNPVLIDDRINNVNKIDGRGVDFEGRYNGLELPGGDIGMVDIRLAASYLDEYDKTQADGSVIEHAGHFIDDQDGYFAHWKMTTDIRYVYRDFLLGYTFRFIGEADETYSDAATGAEFARTVHNAKYHDLYAQYAWKGVTFSAGVENLLDQEPPLSLDGFNDNTDVRTFDTRGRFYYFQGRYNL
jgi:iron complex outermembrane receptor protein